MSGALYRVVLELRIEHLDGPEPAWEDVAVAAVGVCAGETLELRRDGGRSRLLIDEVEVETAGEEPEE
jgi:hypothetical protein